MILNDDEKKKTLHRANKSFRGCTKPEIHAKEN